MSVSRVIWKIITQNISKAMSLRDRAEVTEMDFSEDCSRRTAVDGRRSTVGGRRLAKLSRGLDTENRHRELTLRIDIDTENQHYL